MDENSKSNNCDVIIIGGGISGISCAHHLLHKANYQGNVILLEARDRLGGRIQGKKIAAKTVELGANWIHGIINNPIYNLAAHYNIIDPLAICHNSDGYFSKMAGRTSNGDQVPFKTVYDCYSVYFSMLKRCENYFREIEKGEGLSKIPSGSVGQWLTTEIDKYLEKNVQPSERDLVKSIFESFLNRETCISGCHSMDQVSLPYFGAYEELPGGNVTIPGGYKQLIDLLVRDIVTKLDQESRGNRFQIILNQPVKTIRWPGICSDSKSLKSQVETENGTIYHCQHIVCTIPLGVLKKCHNEMFIPPLPRYKAECIERLGFGVVNKIFLEFKEPLVAKCIEPHLVEILTFWLPKDKEKAQWAVKIYSIAKVNDHCLLVWVSGQEGRFIETLSADEIIQHLIEPIRKFLRFPDLPKPIDAVVTKWGSDPYSQGSYTFLSTRSSVADLTDLAQPIYSNPGQEKPDLIFAGEACHPSFFSTTHGAFLSGRKAAFYLSDADDNYSESTIREDSHKLSNL